MIERVTALHIYSDLNTWIDMLITLENESEFEKAGKIISGAYDRWFTSEAGDDMVIGDYIDSELDKENICHTIYYLT